MTDAEAVDFLLSKNEKLNREVAGLEITIENLKSRIAELESAKKRRPALTLIFSDKSIKTIK
jgi:hypothetical protein